jgi:hypothetical protein
MTHVVGLAGLQRLISTHEIIVCEKASTLDSTASTDEHVESVTLSAEHQWGEKNNSRGEDWRADERKRRSKRKPSRQQPTLLRVSPTLLFTLILCYETVIDRHLGG